MAGLPAVADGQDIMVAPWFQAPPRTARPLCLKDG
jgi:hypothetical protein